MYKGYLLDLDGTIYLGDEVIPAGKRFVERLQEKQIPHLFVTNNSTRLPQAVCDKLAKMDIHIDEKNVYTSSMATADYMDHLNRGKKVYIIGEEGLRKPIIEEHGYVWDEENPDYVVVGLDQTLDYNKLSTATLAIQKGAYFIGTNPDKNIPTHRGMLPSAGPIIAFLEVATGKKADIVGKPNKIMMDQAVEHLHLPKAEVAMVGDNYETDILAGINNDIPSILVLSGFTKKEDIPHLPKQPTHIVDSLDDWNL